MLVVGAFGVAVLSQLRVQAFARQSVLDQGIKSNRFVIQKTEWAKRGDILSADGKALATAEETSQLGIIFKRVPNSPAFFMDLGAASGIPAAEIMQLRASGVKKAFWQERLSPEQTRAVRELQSEWRADGISLGSKGSRSYPLREAVACLIGYTRDGKALTGLEKAFDRQLGGVNGKTIGMVDRGGDFLTLRKDPESVQKMDGKDIRLTLDSEIQLVAASAVKSAVESNQAEQGCAVVIDPATGDILAIANWPSFDPERIGEPLAEGARFNDLNPNYMAVLEPGSTFKILTLALALEKRKASMDERFTCAGSLAVWAGRTVKCDAHGGRRAHGVISPVDAIAKSCNCNAATWAQRIGYEDFTKFLKGSGLMDKPGTGLPSELPGKYNEKEFAKGLQLATFGFGQSLTVTPLALCSAFSMLANGGVRMAPRLVAAVGSVDTKVVSAGRLVSEETARSVMRAMEAVFSSSHGTGKTLRIPGYRLAGKTGTAQKINPATGTVEGGGYVSNFIGYVPAEKPRAAILVMIDHPKSGRYYGATVAGPVFQDIARAVIRRFGIEKSGAELTRTEPKNEKRKTKNEKPNLAGSLIGQMVAHSDAIQTTRASKRTSGPSVEITVRMPGRRVNQGR